MGQKSSKNSSNFDLEEELNYLEKKTGTNKEELREMVNNFSDAKGMSKKEFIAAFTKLNPNTVLADQIAQTLFKNCDVNNDGNICFREFAMTVYFLTKAPKEEKLKHIFKLLDLDGNGTLSSREVVQAVKHAYAVKGSLNFDYNSKGIEIFRCMDRDKDMRVNCDEFVNTCLQDEEVCTLLENMMETISEIKSQ